MWVGEEVFEAAEKVNQGNAFNTAYRMVLHSPSMPLAVPVSAEFYNHGALAVPLAPETVKSDRSYLQDYQGYTESKRESEESTALARNLDSVDALLKELSFGSIEIYIPVEGGLALSVSGASSSNFSLPRYGSDNSSECLFKFL